MTYLIGLILSLSVATISPAHAATKDPIRFGVYKLKGTNPDGLRKYDGKIVIQREGSNYRITWFIGGEVRQAQFGVGILEGKVLSVGYMDATGRDVGVVSLKVLSPTRLKGKWSSILSSGSFGEEELTFETDKIPEALTPKPPKPNPASGGSASL